MRKEVSVGGFRIVLSLLVFCAMVGVFLKYTQPASSQQNELGAQQDPVLQPSSTTQTGTQSKRLLPGANAPGIVRTDEVTSPSAPVGRTIRAVNVGALPGQTVIVEFQLDSRGDEGSASYTVNFNRAILSNPVVVLGTGVPAGATLGTNVNQVPQGRLGILVSTTNSYAQGTRQMIRITFNVAANAPIGLTPIAFAGTPTPQSVSNTTTGALLPTTYETGNVSIQRRRGR